MKNLWALLIFTVIAAVMVCNNSMKTEGYEKQIVAIDRMLKVVKDPALKKQLQDAKMKLRS